MTKSEPAFTIERAGTDEKSFCDVFALLLDLHKEGGFAPLDLEKASTNTYRVLEEGMTFVARSEDGQPVGVLGVIELNFWYSEQSYLQGAWFYVRPEARCGKAGVLLLRAARDEGQARNKIVFISIDNPDRRAKRTPATLLSQEAGFVPLGYTVQLR